MEDILETTKQFVLEKRGDDPLTGLLHAERVRMNALYIAEEVGGRKNLLELAALLHDVAFDGTNTPTHAGESAEMAKNFLRSIGYPPEEIALISRMIHLHDHRSWTKDFQPETLEEKILFDAEAIERLSCIGFLKYVLIASRMKYSPREIVNTYKSFASEVYKNMFFDISRRKAEYDRAIVEKMVKRITEEGRF